MRGDFASVRAFRKRLISLPKSVAHNVAQRAAPAMTALTRGSFASNQSVYGDPRPASVNGGPLTLERTGTTKGTLRFSAAGTIVRCVLGTRYAKYLIGKYGVLPNGALPASWSRKLVAIASEEVAL